ncbi:hypothetical protein BH23DEI1_BH23DEI1_02960 [soil metagenome]
MSVAVTVVQVLVAMTATALACVSLGLLRRHGTGLRRATPWPDVDVILPAHDEEARLGAALASLRAQDYPGAMTIWVVDDRSTDATADVALRAARSDARVRLVRVTRPSSRRSPKVNAVWHGVQAGTAPWIVTTDADCTHHPRWLRTLLEPAEGNVALVAGHVETARPGGARGLLGRVEALDWISLMITARSLANAGRKVAVSANNQAYARAAWRAAGGFGVAARAPSGDEDLLVQRIGRLPGADVIFVDHPHARVLTLPMPGWHAFLDQRRRWVSRFHHLQQYPVGYLVPVVTLGIQSIALALALVALPLVPHARAPVLSAWGILLAVQLVGMHVGLHQLGRRDLMGWPVLAWALCHPFVIAIAVTWSLLRPGSWRAGARSYRRRLLAVRWRRRGRAWWRRAWWRHPPGRAPRRNPATWAPSTTEPNDDRW